MKNKVHTLTFYPDVHSEQHLYEVFPEECLCFEASGDKAVASAPVDFAVEDGKSYFVTFDLVEYEIEAANGVIANDRFSISASGGQMAVSVAEPGHHSVRVVVREEVFTKLPGNYVEGMGWIERSEVELLPPTTLTATEEMDGMAMIPQVVELTPGMGCVVTWQGAEYNCIVQDAALLGGPGAVAVGNIGRMMGGADTGEPFIVLAAAGESMTAFMPLDGGTTFTVAIKGEVETVHPIDEKLLSNGSGSFVNLMHYGFVPLTKGNPKQNVMLDDDAKIKLAKAFATGFVQISMEVNEFDKTDALDGSTLSSGGAVTFPVNFIQDGSQYYGFCRCPNGKAFRVELLMDGRLWVAYTY